MNGFELDLRQLISSIVVLMRRLTSHLCETLWLTIIIAHSDPIRLGLQLLLLCFDFLYSISGLITNLLEARLEVVPVESLEEA